MFLMLYRFITVQVNNGQKKKGHAQQNTRDSYSSLPFKLLLPLDGGVGCVFSGYDSL